MDSSIARRYASAIVESAIAQGGDVLGRIVGDLDSVTTLLDASPDLAHVLQSPVFTIREREKALLAVLDRAALHALSRNLLLLLSERNRFSLLPDIHRIVQKLADERGGRLRADVETAAPLSGETEERLRRALERRTGRQIDLSVKVDASLLGGIRARVGSMVLDGTVRSKLERLKDTLLRTELS